MILISLTSTMRTDTITRPQLSWRQRSSRVRTPQVGDVQGICHDAGLVLSKLRSTMDPGEFKHYMQDHLNWEHYPVQIDELKQRYFLKHGGAPESLTFGHD